MRKGELLLLGAVQGYRLPLNHCVFVDLTLASETISRTSGE